MNHSGQVRWWLAFFAAGWVMVLPASAQNSPPAPASMELLSAPTNAVPLPPILHSPVDFFRKLLAMSPAEREQFLTNKPPEIRTQILVKVHEYLALDPNVRELRLRATELRWYLMPLLRNPPTNQAAVLARIPEDMRELVKSRLQQWEILPPPLKQEFLDNENALHYFARVDPTNQPPMPDGFYEAQRRKIAAQFNQFFELTPLEKQKALNTLSEAERKQMGKTLQAFNKLPPGQRMECINAYSKFATMSPAERAEFLKNAARWAQMSPRDRQTWRDLVANVPQWPPLPIGFVPQSSVPAPPPNFQSALVTNHN
jgi:Protein of unknown function (DUF3106)